MGGRRAPCVTHTFVTGREHDVVEALRAGDERAFAAVVDELSPGMLRMARHYVRTDAAAEEVVQEAWLVVVNGLDDFEGRSTLRTWVFGIVINIARGQGVRDARTVPFAALVDEGAEPAIGPERFLPADHDRWPGHWAIGPAPWPDHALETAEALAVLREAVAALPEAQRAVITLRDVVGCSAEETCNALGLSATNQRVLLHRARTRVRVALETYFEATVRLT
jgi:RNA polymerase sigma-70 factor (ECF subfamily)